MMLKNIVLNFIRKIFRIQIIENKLDDINQNMILLADNINKINAKFDILNSNLLAINGCSEVKYLKVNDKVDLKLYKNDNGLSYCRDQDYDDAKILPRLFLITLPKSGTYLISKILELLGYQDNELHASFYGIDDYRGMSKNDKLNLWPAKITKLMEFNTILSFLNDNQFLRGHFEFVVDDYIENEKKIISIRELREVFVSAYRFYKTRHYYSNYNWFSLQYGEEGLYEFLCCKEVSIIISLAKDIAKWCAKYPQNIIRFEDLVEFTPARNENIINVFYENTSCSPEMVNKAIVNALGLETMTWSGKKSNLDIWSDRIEQKFIEIGGGRINEKLGYSTNWKK